MRKTLYKFGAPWCSPCKDMEPLLSELSTDIEVVRVDIDQEPEKGMALGVRSVPSLIMVDEAGKALAFRSGGINRAQLQQFIRSAS